MSRNVHKTVQDRADMESPWDPRGNEMSEKRTALDWGRMTRLKKISVASSRGADQNTRTMRMV